LIRRLFPEAKVVAISRDGRDVAASLSRMSWMSADVYVNFLVWLYYNRVLRAARERGCPNLYWVRYEDIVADPEAELGKVLDFLELPYESAVAEGSGNREGIPVREYGWKKRALGHISDNRVGTFRRELSADQVALLERLGTSTLCSLGYELTTDGSARLSPRFLLGLGLRMSHFVYRLPWQSVINELLSRASRAPADSAAGVSTVVPALI
jgi:hypothetical protein